MYISTLNRGYVPLRRNNLKKEKSILIKKKTQIVHILNYEKKREKSNPKRVSKNIVQLKLELPLN